MFTNMLYPIYGKTMLRPLNISAAVVNADVTNPYIYDANFSPKHTTQREGNIGKFALQNTMDSIRNMENPYLFAPKEIAI